MNPIQTLSSPPSLQELRQVARAVCQALPVACLQVFGSMARGDADAASDIDLLVDFLPDAKVGLIEMGDMKEELESVLGRPVDLVSRPAVEAGRNPIRRRAILANAVTIYAR